MPRKSLSKRLDQLYVFHAERLGESILVSEVREAALRDLVREQRQIRSAHKHAKAAEKAIHSLDLSKASMTKADQQRVDLVWRGLVALDDEQSEIKDRIDDALGEHAKTGDTPALIQKLKDLIR